MLSSQFADKLVRKTNDDATVSKLSCARSGYIDDDFVHFFVQQPQKRPPILNRGYYSRIAALQGILAQFLRAAAVTERTPRELITAQPETAARFHTAAKEHNASALVKEACSSDGCKPPTEAAREPQRRQVLSLGAGFDSSWFHRKGRGKDLPEQWVEVDFLEVTLKKLGIMRRTSALSQLIDPLALVNEDAGSLLSSEYSLVPADLRDTAQLMAALKASGLQFQAPTLVLAECVLVYMMPQESTALITLLGALLPNAIFAVYEQIKPHDPFGRQMLHNLRERGCPLLGIEFTPDLDAQMQRFLNCGWSRAIAKDMATIHRRHIDPVDCLRAERREIFDEVEEWNLMQEHYCIAVGINDRDGLFSSFDFENFH